MRDYLETFLGISFKTLARDLKKSNILWIEMKLQLEVHESIVAGIFLLYCFVFWEKLLYLTRVNQVQVLILFIGRFSEENFIDPYRDLS